MHNPKISIVIPMFNCEKYIQPCIDSILNQTFEDFELIIIDDFSTDQSLKIVDSYRDSRIKLFRRAKNFGRSSARNFGLELSRGEFIFFMDHDDAILPNTLDTLIHSVDDFDVIYMNSFFETINADFSMSDEIQVDKKFSRDSTPRILSQNLVDRLQSEYVLGGTMVNTWIRFSRRDCLVDNEIFFPILPRNEDGLVHFATLCLAKKIRVIDACCYIHRSHPDNAMNQSAERHLKLTLESLSPAISYMEEIFERTNLSRENFGKLEAFTLNEMIRWLIVQRAYSGEMEFAVIDKMLRDNLTLDKNTNCTIFHALSLVLKWIYLRDDDSIFKLRGEI